MRRIKSEPTQKNKKLITFTNYELIDRYTKDIAEMEQTNVSAVIENIILKQILAEADFDATNYYIKKIYSDGLKDAFIALFQNLSAGIQGKSTHTNAYALVNLCLKITNRPFMSGFDPDYKYLEDEHLVKNCKAVREKIEYQKSKENLNFDQKIALDDDISLLKQTENHAVDFVPYNYFRLVLARWNTLGNYTYTFRMLMDVVALSEPDLWDSAKYRLQAIEIIKSVTESWDIY